MGTTHGLIHADPKTGGVNDVYEPRRVRSQFFCRRRVMKEQSRRIEAGDSGRDDPALTESIADSAHHLAAQAESDDVKRVVILHSQAEKLPQKEQEFRYVIADRVNVFRRDEVERRRPG